MAVWVPVRAPPGSGIRITAPATARAGPAASRAAVWSVFQRRRSARGLRGILSEGANGRAASGAARRGAVGLARRYRQGAVITLILLTLAALGLLVGVLLWLGVVDRVLGVAGASSGAASGPGSGSGSGSSPGVLAGLPRRPLGLLAAGAAAAGPARAHRRLRPRPSRWAWPPAWRTCSSTWSGTRSSAGTRPSTTR